MKKGDQVFFYHSGTGKEVVGIARVTREAYSDPTATEGDWSCVDLAPVTSLARPVSLDVIKADKILRDLPTVKLSRISVTAVPSPQARRLLELGRK
jgi:predicted RNA-binding protein with PUA-like domain